MCNDGYLSLKSLVLPVGREFLEVAARLICDSLEYLRTVSFTQIEKDVDTCLVYDISIGIRETHISQGYSLDLVLRLIRF